MNKCVSFIFSILVSIGVFAQSTSEECVYFTKGEQATIILPTAPNVDKGIYYRLDRCENGQIVFVEEPNPQAYTPYVIVPKENFSIDWSVLDLEGDVLGLVKIDGISFIGYSHRDYVGCIDSFYYFIIDNTPDCLRDVNEPIIGALRAYLEVDSRIYPNSEKGMEIILINNASPIEHLSFLSRNEVECIYDFQGRHLSSKPQKGLYIQNGKKMIVK